MADDALDPLFDAAAEATEQAIANALFAAQTTEGRAGHIRKSIASRLPDWRARVGEAGRTGWGTASDPRPHP